MKIRNLIPLLLLGFPGNSQISGTASFVNSPHRSNGLYDCGKFLGLNTYGSSADFGQIPITGDQITVEAVINRTTPYSGGLLYAGDVVSKHDGPNDVNYLLRPNDAEITTTDGHYYRTPDICEIELNKTYHVAMVYDGKALKFYRDGFLMSQVAASGQLYQNNWTTRVGFYQNQTVNTNFIGYINEVRIWKVARTQDQIRANMATSLASPSTEPGLVAYYTFDNLINKTGSGLYNGSLVGSAALSQSPGTNCPLVVDSCNTRTLTPNFTIPDTVCVNTPVTISNTTSGATTSYWNFCVADIDKAPIATNLGNPGGFLASPTFMDYAQYNGNWYGIATNYQDGKLTRLDFGNSLLNTPSAVSLGNFPGALIPTNIISEGIQIVFNEGRWYAIVVGSANTAGTEPRIFKVDFGPNLTNTNPVVTDWGNIGNLAQPIDLHVFKDDNGEWYGFTTNSENNTITRFNFTSSFSNTPTAVNLGNVGNLAYPTGIFAINDNGFWRVFVVNGGDNTTTSGIFSLSRLDFGSSLLNTPTGVNLGNPGNTLQHPRDITIMRSCGQIVGFATNGHPSYNDVVKLNFNNDLTSTPSAVSLGSTGGTAFPHSISKLFRVNDDLYSFITNATGSSNSITRLQFAGCTNASVASSTLFNPAPITYNAPGTYNINLTIDDGLATQNSTCKQVVVVPPLVHTPTQKVTSCTGATKIGTGVKGVSYLWNTGATTDSILVSDTGTYWVLTKRFGCSNIDSFQVKLSNLAIKSSNDTSICAGQKVPLQTTSIAGATYAWTPAGSVSNATIYNPQSNALNNTTQFIVTVTDANKCVGKDTVLVNVNPLPTITRTRDTLLCHDKTLQLNASGGTSYQWSPAASLSNATVANPIASPAASTLYSLVVTNAAGCSKSDSVRVTIKPKPVFAISSAVSTCTGTAVNLLASGGNQYSWLPATGLSNATSANPVANPGTSTVYTVKIVETTCFDSTTLSTTVSLLPLPAISATVSNEVTCTTPAANLSASGGVSYVWKPGLGLSDSIGATVLASPPANTSYIVKGTGSNGCSGYDTVEVKVSHTGDLDVKLPNAFSPNGDGKNECFGITRYGSLLQQVDLSVYNRWGQRVFHTTDPANCWNGKFNGKLQPTGGYAYVLKANTFCGQVFRKGIVMLLY